MEETRTLRIGEEHTGQGGDVTELTDIDEETGADVKEVYVGPSALWVAKLMPRSVNFSQGWFWTTTEICHEGRSNGLAFRQRPDGNGIDVRCHTRGCSRDAVVAGLELATGQAIGNAYEPLAEPVDDLWWLRGWPRWRIELYGVAALAFCAPLLLGLGPAAALLSYLCFIVGSWLTGRHMMRHRKRRFLR